MSHLRPPSPAQCLYVQGHMTKVWQRRVAGVQMTASGNPEEWWYTSQATGKLLSEAPYDYLLHMRCISCSRKITGGLSG